MKLPALIATAVLLVFSLGTCAFALPLDTGFEEEAGVSEMEKSVPEDAREILGNISVSDSFEYDGLLQRIAEYGVGKARGIVSATLKSAALMVIIAFVCAAAEAFYSGSRTPDYIPLAGTAAIAAVAIGNMSLFLGLGVELLGTLADFSRILLPGLAAVAVAAGGFTSAAAKYAGSAMFIDLLMNAATGIIMPLIYCYIAAVVANAALGGRALSSAASLIKWLCTALMTLLVMGFTAYLGIVGIVKGAADAFTTRAVKAAISASLPIVGSIVSDAAGTVVSGAGLLRNAIGVFGMIVVLAACTVPFLTLGAHYLLYKAAAALADCFADKRLSGLMSGLGTAFGMVLALAGTGVIALFLAIISCVRAVTG